MKGERDAQRRALVVAAIQAGATVRDACKRAGLSRATVYAWAARGGDPELEALLATTSTSRQRRTGAPASRATRPPAVDAPAAAPTPLPAPEPVRVAPARRVGLGPVDPATGLPIPDDEFVTRLHALGLGVLARMAEGKEAAKADRDRIAAAKELVQHAERWDAVRRAMLAPPPEAAPAAPVAPPIPAPARELSPTEAASRFRVVKGAG